MNTDEVAQYSSFYSSLKGSLREGVQEALSEKQRRVHAQEQQVNTLKKKERLDLPALEDNTNTTAPANPDEAPRLALELDGSAPASPPPSPPSPPSTPRRSGWLSAAAGTRWGTSSLPGG